MSSARHHQALIQPNGGSVMAYRDLPEEAQMAILQYLAIDGEAWEFSFEFVYPYSNAVHVEMLRARLPEAIDRYGDERFGIVQVPMEDLVADVYQVHVQGRFADFAQYHAWYLGEKGVEDHGASLWPVILSELPEETFEDGWHRFHAYYRSGVTLVPCVYFPGRAGL